MRRLQNRPTTTQAWLLALLLLAAQALGISHRVAHGGGWVQAFAPSVLSIEPVASVGSVAALGSHRADAAAGRTAQIERAEPSKPVDEDTAVGLHDHEAGTPLCLLVDQLGHADALSGLPAVSAGIAPASCAASGPPTLPAAAREPPAYQARAPPRA